MVKNIIIIAFLLLGAIIAFGSSKLAPVIFKREPDDKDIVMVKSVGFVIVIIAAILTFVIK